MSERFQDSLYGIHAVLGGLQKDPGHLNCIWLAEGRCGRRIEQIRVLAGKARIPVHLATVEQLDALSSGGRHQGVVAVCERRRARNEADLEALLSGLDQPPLLLVLDGVQDPHNLGACLRTADAAGVHAVIAPRDRAAGITPVARKVACGAAESVPFIRVTNLARTLRQLKKSGVWLAGLDEGAPDRFYDTDLTGALALILGAEGKGLRRLTREHCDLLLAIPMAGLVSSLNVSVAAGVCLFEAARQRALNG